MPLQNQLSGPERLRGRLGRRLTDGLRLAELTGEVTGPGGLTGAQGGGGEGQRLGQVAGAGRLKALEGLLHLLSGGQHLVSRGAAGEEGPGRRWGRRDDWVVWLEGHPAAGDMLWRESHGWQGVSELDRGRYQRLVGGRRGRTLLRRRWDGF